MDQNHLCYHYTTGQTAVRRRMHRLNQPLCPSVSSTEDMHQARVIRTGRSGKLVASRTLPLARCRRASRNGHGTLDAANATVAIASAARSSSSESARGSCSRPVPSRLGHRRGRIGAPCEACRRSPRRPIDEGSSKIPSRTGSFNDLAEFGPDLQRRPRTADVTLRHPCRTQQAQIVWCPSTLQRAKPSAASP
jgi:hypothetical protein